MKKFVLLATVLLVSVTSAYAQFTFHNIDFPGAVLTRVRGINSHGVIVGAYRQPGGVNHAMMIENGKFIPLAPTTILGTNWNEASKINDRGDIVGFFLDDNGYTHGFLLRKSVLTILDFPGASETFATDINESGTVVGWWDILDANGTILSNSGFIWDNGSFSEVNFSGAGFTSVVGINARGDFVGQWGSDPNGLAGHGFFFKKAKGQFTSFDVPFPDAITTQANDINASGDIVGVYWDASGLQSQHGFLVTGTDYTSINYPGAAQTRAWGINSVGQMVGYWFDSTGYQHGWLAQPGNKGKPSSLPKPLDLIGWWPGDGNANDIRGGSNGVLMNGTTFAPGLVGQAFLFDGIDDFVDVPDTATLHAITTSITEEAWINPDIPPNGCGWVFARRNPGDTESASLGINADGYLNTQLTTDQSGYIDIYSTVPVIHFDGKWQHITVTADTATGQVILYLNGKPIAAQPITGSLPITGRFAEVSYVFIGHREIGEGSCTYKGLIDEVKMYNRALTASEIKAIYLAGGRQK